MNTLILMAMPNLQELLIGFLIIIVMVAVIAGLIYAIETWVMKAPIPPPIKLVIGLVLIVLVILWAIGAIGVH